MANPLVSAITTLGTVFDTPRAMLWAALAGRNPISAAFNPQERIRGEDVTGEPISGTLLEMLADPLNLLGVAKIGQLASAAKKQMGFYDLWRSRQTAIQAARMAGQARARRFRRLKPLFTDRGTQRVMAFGPAEEAAQVALADSGYLPARLTDEAARLERPGRVWVYEPGPQASKQNLGFTLAYRPDLLFLRKQDLLTAAGTRAHEAAHLVDSLDPDRYDRLVALFKHGPEYAAETANAKPSLLMQEIEEKLAKIPTRWRSPKKAEEHAANLVTLLNKKELWKHHPSREVVPTLTHRIIESNPRIPEFIAQSEWNPDSLPELVKAIDNALEVKGYPAELREALAPEITRLAILDVPSWSPPPPPPKVPKLPPEMKNWRMRAPEKRIPSLAAALVGYNAPRIMRPLFYED